MTSTRWLFSQVLLPNTIHFSRVQCDFFRVPTTFRMQVTFRVYTTTFPGNIYQVPADYPQVPGSFFSGKMWLRVLFHFFLVVVATFRVHGDFSQAPTTFLEFTASIRWPFARASPFFLRARPFSPLFLSTRPLSQSTWQLFFPKIYDIFPVYGKYAGLFFKYSVTWQISDHFRGSTAIFSE